MNVKMREEDRRAMDILLDRSAVAAGKSNGVIVFATVDEHIRRRMAAVKKVLGLLENAVAADPPRHLMERTLRMVEQASGRAVSAPPAAHSLSSAFGAPPVA